MLIFRGSWKRWRFEEDLSAAMTDLLVKLLEARLRGFEHLLDLAKLVGGDVGVDILRIAIAVVRRAAAAVASTLDGRDAVEVQFGVLAAAGTLPDAAGAHGVAAVHRSRAAVRREVQRRELLPVLGRPRRVRDVHFVVRCFLPHCDHQSLPRGIAGNLLYTRCVLTLAASPQLNMPPDWTTFLPCPTLTPAHPLPGI
jgi:hypothetical protein